jgi:hypothetical protein
VVAERNADRRTPLLFDSHIESATPLSNCIFKQCGDGGVGGAEMGRQQDGRVEGHVQTYPLSRKGSCNDEAYIDAISAHERLHKTARTSMCNFRASDGKNAMNEGIMVQNGINRQLYRTL